jgi:hypothetical protein
LKKFAVMKKKKSCNYGVMGALSREFWRLKSVGRAGEDECIGFSGKWTARKTYTEEEG